MEIRVTEQPDEQETQVNIICKKRDEHIELILTEDEKLYGKMPDGAMTEKSARELLYVESVDGRCFVYTESAACEAMCRLCDLEAALPERLFCRVSKSMIVNLAQVKRLEPERQTAADDDEERRAGDCLKTVYAGDQEPARHMKGGQL